MKIESGKSSSTRRALMEKAYHYFCEVAFEHEVGTRRLARRLCVMMECAASLNDSPPSPKCGRRVTRPGAPIQERTSTLSKPRLFNEQIGC